LPRSDMPRVGVLEPGENPEQRRLPRAVRADDPDPRAQRDLELEPVQDRPASERLLELVRGEDGHGVKDRRNTAGDDRAEAGVSDAAPARPARGGVGRARGAEAQGRRRSAARGVAGDRARRAAYLTRYRHTV